MADAEEGRLVGDLAVKNGLGVKPVVLVVAQDDCPRGTVPAEPLHLADDGLLALAPDRCDKEVERARRGVPVLVVLMLVVQARELAGDGGGVRSRRLPAAALDL
jgi:hypothetical protein